MTARQKAAQGIKETRGPLSVGGPVLIVWIAEQFGLALPMDVAMVISSVAAYYAGQLRDD